MAKLVIVSALSQSTLTTVEMPNATTIKYACKRVAEDVGWDPDWKGLFLASSLDGAELDEDDLAVNYDGQKLFFGRKTA